ncbi:MAG: TatD family hydrolase [Candidatus Omnitrophica bacterium]|nr:TatD family hydrolase [Candidatus Omnitrophota bacterium]
MLIDAHCHINSLDFQSRDNLFSETGEGFIFIDSGIDYQSSCLSLKLADLKSYIYSSIGFHPFSCDSFNSETISKYRSLLEENNKIVAIGEIGLDETSTVEIAKQEEIFRLFVALAADYSKPILIHNRFDSFRILEILDECFPVYPQVVFHCFSYSPVFLKEIIKRRGYVSFSLNLLRNKKNITESLMACPVDRLILETDAPYMRIKGALSSPKDIVKTYEAVCRLKDLDQITLEKQVALNVRSLFGINL